MGDRVSRISRILADSYSRRRWIDVIRRIRVIRSRDSAETPIDSPAHAKERLRIST